MKYYDKGRLTGILLFCVLSVALIASAVFSTAGLTTDSYADAASDWSPAYFSSDTVLDASYTEDVTDTYIKFDADAITNDTIAMVKTTSGSTYTYRVSGDFHTEDTQGFNANSVEVCGTDDRGLKFGGRQPSSPWYCDLKASEALMSAINDPLIDVEISLYVTWTSPNTCDNDSEKSNVTMCYYSGGYDANGTAVSNSVSKTVSFNAANVRNQSSSIIASGFTLQLSDMDAVANQQGYLRIVFDDWQTGNIFSIAWEEMHVQVKTSRNNSVTVGVDTTKVAVYDPTGMRNTDKTTLVKAGDIVVLESYIEKDGVKLDLVDDKAAVGDDESGVTAAQKYADGYFYARKYLKGGDKSRTFMQYTFNSAAHLEQLYEYDFPEDGDFTYKGTLDLKPSADFSGTKAIFRVKESTDTSLPITVSTWQKSGVSTGRNTIINLQMDNTKPNAPGLDASSTFYTKYIRNKSFYTDEYAYVYEDKETVAGSGVTSRVITGINLGAGAAIPQFSSNATTIEENGSDIFIYVKSTIVEKIPNIQDNSTGFDPSEGTLYCHVYADTGIVEYDSFVLSLITTDETTGAETINKSGFYRLEFVAVDEAGNYIYYPTRQYMKVDVTDYQFDVSLVLGLGAADGSIINMSDATPSFATIKDDGTVSDYVTYTSSDKISFKRGDKVVAKMKMSSSGANKYILTSFQTGGSVNISTTSNTYSNYATVITDAQRNYAFEVNTTYSNDPSTRTIKFVFKQKVYINILKSVVTYGATDKGVKAEIRDGKGSGSVKLDKLSPTITYSKTKDGEYTTTVPEDRGIYYFRCELLNHNKYYATTVNDGLEHTYEVKAATPDIGGSSNIVVEEIKYGQSFAEIDYVTVKGGQLQNFNTHINLVYGGQYYYDRSLDGVTGYYTLAVTDKTSSSYTNPSAGTVTMNIKFVPIKAKSVGVPAYAGDGGFVRDENYNEVQLQINVTVRRSTETSVTIQGLDDATGNIVYDYDGGRKTLDYSIVSTLNSESGYSLKEYAVVYYRKDIDGEEYSNDVPTEAGNYRVKIELNSGCNYTISDAEYKLVIQKRKLNVLCAEVEYDYGKPEDLSPVASFGTGSSKLEYNSLDYIYCFYPYVEGESYASAAKDEVLIGNTVPQNAGKYVVKIVLDENNFENASAAYTLLTINMVSSTKVTFVSPTLKAVYGDSHIRYLQPLKSVVLSENSNSGVRYNGQSINGSFVVSYRPFASSGHENETVEEFRRDSEEYIVTETGKQNMYLCFVPSGEDALNFEVSQREIELVVGKAKPVFTDMSVQNIVYLTEIKSVDDLVFDGKAKVLVYGTEYKELDKDDSEYGYTASFYVSGTKKYTAGTHNIDIRITFDGTEGEKIEETVYSFAITVEKYELSLSAQNDSYSDNNGGYEYRYGAVGAPVVNNDKNVSVKSETKYYDASGAELLAENLTAGSYEAVYTVVDDNYCGELRYNVTVTKADVRWVSLPKIYEEKTAVSFGKLISAVSFNSGEMVADKNGVATIIPGKYYFDYPEGTLFLDTGVAKNYALKFVPDDTDNYNEYSYDGKNGFCLYLTVSKQDISEGITLSLKQEYVYGDLEYDFAPADIIGEFDTPIYVKKTQGEYFYSSVKEEGYETLGGSFAASGIAVGGKIGAGTYPFTYTVDDPNYSGSVTVDLVVNKKQAVIIVDAADCVLDFNNMSQNVKYVLRTADGQETLTESVTQAFYLGTARLSSAPTDIGKYTAELSLRSNNYYADTLTLDFVIRINEKYVTVANTEQVYSVPRQVTAVIRLIDAVYSMSFVEKTKDSFEEEQNPKILEEMPTDAGSYWILLHFAPENNNGYEETIVYEKTLEIEKYTATIKTSDSISVSYTGISNGIRVTTEPYGLTCKVEYKGENDSEYSDKEIVDANSEGKTHLIRITIVDSNYCGEKTVFYKINPVALEEGSAPIYKDYSYGDDAEPTIKTAGVMLFGSKVITGEYSIDVEDVRTLSVALHNVKYTFVATKEGADGITVVDGNYLPYTGTTKLTVTKRRIAEEDIVLGEQSGYYAYYNGQKFSVDAYIREGAIPNPELNSDLTIKIYYNNQTTLPKEPGTYTVRAEISSRNFSGSKTWDKNFVVEKGSPVIATAPTPDESKIYRINDTFLPSDLVQSSGRAVIAGTDVEIFGTFVATEKTFVKANANDVSVEFRPNDSMYYNSVSFTIKINVLGTDPFTAEGSDDWDGELTGVGGQKITLSAYYAGMAYYGVKASEFTIKVSGDADSVSYFNTFGVFNKADPDEVPDVGGKIRVKFTPMGTNADSYNIVYGYLSVEIQKADLPEPTVELVTYSGKTLSESKIIVRSDGKIIDLSGSITLFDGATPIDMSSIVSDGEYNYVFVSNNYNDIVGSLTIKTKQEIVSENIIAEYTEKAYDGQNITPADLGIKIINTDAVVTYEDMTATVYKDGKETAHSTAAGEYTVLIIVDNGILRGEKSFVFVVKTRDVSEDMTIEGDTTVYGSVRAPKLLVDGEEATGYTILYKPDGASDAMFSQYLPDLAGKYIARITVEKDDYYGSKDFDFVISPKQVRVVAEAIYTYDYGKASSPVVTFKENDSEDSLSLEYNIYYYSDSYSLSEKNTLPTAAGTYKARVELVDSNYTIGDNGYTEFKYEIKRLTTVIRELPTVISHTEDGVVYNIRYGQKAGEISLSGGVAKYGDDAISGVFRVKDSDYVPDAGSNIIDIEFVPGDSNYATATGKVTIFVAQAEVSVTLTNVMGVYTGTTTRDDLTYTLSPSGVKVKVQFIDTDDNEVEPIAAGTYYIVVSSLDKNYVVTSLKGSGTGNPVFVVNKAEIREVIAPFANEISVGDSLNKSSLSATGEYGKVFYYGFNNPVEGRFEYIERSLTYQKAGTYSAGYVFTPTDASNFASYTGTVEVKVNRALATIQVSGTQFVYSEGFSYPTFTTNPDGLVPSHDITFAEYDPTAPGYIYKESDYVDVGTYYFHVWVDTDDYYSDKLEFAIEIKKKTIDMDFVETVDGVENVVMQYQTTYGKLLDAKIKLYPAGTVGKTGYLLKDYDRDALKLGEEYEIKYESTTSGVTYSASIPPSDIGVYKVTVTLRNNNYTATNETIYKINTGKIEEVYFDTDTLENQIYGSVVAPIITTSPANVSYYILYQGYGTEIPKDAGSYHITVYFNDDNYEKLQSTAMFKINKKPLSVTNIQVEDKVYDGIPNIGISGQLSGLVFGDEVSLKMSARTLNDEIKVGSYSVVVTEYKLTGLQAGNYDLAQPVYTGKVNIKTNKIETSSSSFITSTNGFDAGTKVSFATVNSEKYKTTLFERLTGRDSKVVGYSVEVNGADTIIKDTFKVYMAIPEEYRDCEFEVVGVGKLEGQEVIFTREGDYITFNVSSSGQVLFKKTEFQYGFVVIAAAVAIAVIGIVVLLIVNPLQSRRKISDGRAEEEAIRRIKQW